MGSPSGLGGNDDGQHPADTIAEAFKGLIDGSNFRQSLRDAWDRITTKAQAPAPAESQQMNWKPQANAQQQQQISGNAAAAIRAKAKGQ